MIMKLSEVTFLTYKHEPSQPTLPVQQNFTHRLQRGFESLRSGHDPESRRRAVCQGEASSASTWLKTLVLFEKNEEHRSSFLFSSGGGYFLPFMSHGYSYAEATMPLCL